MVNNQKIRLSDNVIIVANKRNNFILKISPFYYRDINQDVIEVIKFLNEGKTLEEFIGEKSLLNDDVSKLNIVIKTLLDDKILEISEIKSNNSIKECSHDIPLERLFLSVTENCNMRCKHCYVDCDDENCINDELSLEEIKSLIDQAIQLGLWQVDLTGGEIFCRKDIFNIIDYIALKNLNINLFTNGSLIDTEIVEKLNNYKNNISRIIVSFDTIDENVYEEFRQLKGSYSKLLNGLSFLKDSGFHISVNLPFMSENEHNIHDTINYIKSNFTDDITIYPILEFGRGKNIGFKCDIESLANIKRQLSGDLLDKSIKNNLANGCGVGDNFAFIEANGEVALCPTLSHKFSPNLKIDNIKSASLKQIWNENELIKRFRNTNCKELNICSSSESCKGGCRSNAYYDNNCEFDGKDILSCHFHQEIASGNTYEGSLTNESL